MKLSMKSFGDSDFILGSRAITTGKENKYNKIFKK